VAPPTTAARPHFAKPPRRDTAYDVKPDTTAAIASAAYSDSLVSVYERSLSTVIHATLIDAAESIATVTSRPRVGGNRKSAAAATAPVAIALSSAL